MLGYELRLWRKGCGWTQERAAEEFEGSDAQWNENSR